MIPTSLSEIIAQGKITSESERVIVQNALDRHLDDHKDNVGWNKTLTKYGNLIFEWEQRQGWAI